MVEFYAPPDLPLGVKYARVVKSFAIGLIYGPMSPSIYWVVGAGFLMGCASDTYVTITMKPNGIDLPAAISMALCICAAGTYATSSRASTTTATRHVSPTRCARACATCSPSSSAATWA